VRPGRQARDPGRSPVIDDGERGMPRGHDDVVDELFNTDVHRHGDGIRNRHLPHPDIAQRIVRHHERALRLCRCEQEPSDERQPQSAERSCDDRQHQPTDDEQLAERASEPRRGPRRRREVTAPRGQRVDEEGAAQQQRDPGPASATRDSAPADGGWPLMRATPPNTHSVIPWTATRCPILA
jgi:hypothetical protein